MNDTDLAILQLIREGYTAKEIGAHIGLSGRTIEHKLERLKTEFGARSLAHLVVLSIASATAVDGTPTDLGPRVKFRQ